MPNRTQEMDQSLPSSELSAAKAALDSLVLAHIAQGEIHDQLLATPVAYRGHPNAFAGLRALGAIIDRRREAIARLDSTD